MLKKLIKYDLKWMFKFLLIFYSLATVFGIITRLMTNVTDSLIMDIVKEFCSGFAIAMVCSTLINNIMRMWVRFKNHLYGDESYLTHTLPVEKSTHYLSKIITTVITLFVSFLVVGLVLFIMFYSKENIEAIKSLLLPLAELYDSSVLGFLIVILFVLFIEFFNILQCGFTGIILGHRMNNMKTGFSVIFGFITFTVSQIAVVVITFIAAIFNKDFMNLFKTAGANINIDTLKLAIFLAIAAYILISIILCLVNIKLFKKGVNVD